ncbi:ERF family protein [Synechococcus sp. CCAP 1479/9]|uniref:ERF family protein n=1 Tax=Synechococcus sp. CCAP 1479/9 TaxID=1221593 RepID=UPI001C2386F5|nr:ERF family protein [Synechococcus sp. CCAP 1479/9]
MVTEPQPSYPDSLELSLLAFHRNVGPIRKQSEAKYGAFADLRTVLEAITPHLLDQGLVLTQNMAEGPDGSCLLRTVLTHAPSGDAISSSCPIPTLQGLLDRVHQLRQEALQRFPIDMPLAALGALPPVLPPRPADGDTALPPLPPRQPGLRLDDQLKGLHTLLGQLGTTTNPLHSLGGTVTYLRRYQILSLLCLAAEDSDGVAERQPPQSTCQPSPQASPLTAPPAPPAAPTRRRRAVPPAPAQSQPSGPRPAPTPAPPAAAPPQPEQAPGPSEPEAAPQEPSAATEPGPAQVEASQTQTLVNALTPSEVQQLIGEIRSLPVETIPHLVSAFRQQFRLPDRALVSDYISTAEHAAFIRQQVIQLAPAIA